jgi:hypothetical protein
VWSGHSCPLPLLLPVPLPVLLLSPLLLPLPFSAHGLNHNQESACQNVAVATLTLPESDNVLLAVR